MRVCRASAISLMLLAAASTVSAQTYPTTNFRTTHPISGRDQPTQVRFAHDGRVFVAEKAGAIWMYQNLLDTAPCISTSSHAFS